MLLKKGVLCALFVLPTLGVATVSLGGGADSQQDEVVVDEQQATASIEALNKKCEDSRKDGQLKEFKIRVFCSGNYSEWSELKEDFTLTNSSVMFTHTSTKGGRYETSESMHNQEGAQQVGQCSVWTKKVMTAPVGMGIPVLIDKCQKLTATYLRNRCQEEVKDYCDDQFVEEGAAQKKR